MEQVTLLQDIGEQNMANGYLQFQVQTTTLDEFFKEQGWTKVDLIKMDIEGYEYYALEGMTELNRRNPKLEFFIEFGPTYIQRAGSSAEAFIATLKDLGFKTFYIIECPTPLRLDLLRELSNLLAMIPSDGSQML